MPVKTSAWRVARRIGKRQAIFLLLIAVTLLALSSLAVRAFFRQPPGRKGFIWVEDLHSCLGFAEVRRTVIFGFLAAHSSDRCLVLPGLPAALKPSQNGPFDANSLATCAGKMQTCLAKIRDDSRPDAVVNIRNLSQLMDTSVSHVAWSWSAILSTQYTQDDEAMFWKATQCLDNSHTSGLSTAANILHAALDKTFDMILGGV